MSHIKGPSQFSRGYTLGISPDYDRLAYEMHRSLDDEPFLVLPIGYGAYADFEDYLKKPLSKTGARFSVHRLDQVDVSKGEDGEYRKITTRPIGVNKSGAKVAVALENSIRREGSGIVGGLVWTLQNSQTLGVERIHAATMVDEIGVANFHAWGRYPIYMGPRRFIEERKPETFRMLHEKNLLDLLSGHKPECEYGGYLAVEIGEENFWAL